MGEGSAVARTMRAVLLTAVGEPLVDATVDVPVPQRGEVLVRVRAAGLCRSDVHYRFGGGTTGALPHVLGHEIAGEVAALGEGVTELSAGDRVAVHYLVTCGSCSHCRRGREQFCPTGRMIGKDVHGGYAEFVCVPARNCVRVPEVVPYPHAAVMMCSTVTAMHALARGDMRHDELVAVFGVGGLGVSCIQLARLMGARSVFAVDVIPDKLALAKDLGAIPIDARNADVVAEILRLTGGEGVDVSVDFAGIPSTQSQSVKCLARHGRCVIVALSTKPIDLNPYRDILCKEASIVGCSDHLHGEVVQVLDLAARGALDMSRAVSVSIPLSAADINAAMDALRAGTSAVRTVIVP